MTQPPETSDKSGEILDSSAPTEVTYIFEDGHRRSVTMTTTEAGRLRAEGKDRTSRWARFRSWISVKGILKWTAAAIVGALIANGISDGYSDRQAEIELEATLVKEINGAATTLFQEAQNASREASGVVDPAARKAMRDKPANAWVLASSNPSTVMKVYYPDGSGLVDNWFEFQNAMYDWAVLGCCTTSPGRQDLVDSIHEYLDTHVGPATREPPVPDPWTALAATDSPASDLYQWVGLYLLQGRRSIREDLLETDAQLD